MGRRIFAACAGAWIVAASVAVAAEPAHITVSPGSGEFENLCVGGSSTKSFTITNDGNVDATINSITKTGADDFILSTPTSESFSLSKGEKSKPFTVTFRPSSRNAVSGTIHVAWKANDQGQPEVTVPLTGKGIDRRLEADQSSVGFGDQRVGTRSPLKSLSIRNRGGDPVTVSAVDRGGAHGGDFVLTAPAVPFTIAAGDFRTVSVAFQPSGPGLRTGTIGIASNACNAPAIGVGVVGTGVVPNVSVLPSSVDAGTTPRGAQGPAVPVTVSSEGGTPLKITAVQIAGPDAKDFALSGLPAFPVTVQPQDSFVFSVRMTPSAEGLRVATLNVVSDDSDNPTTAVPLRGTGGPATPSPTPTGSASPTASASPSPSRSATPRAAPGKANDSLAIWLVVGGVLGAFGSLVVIRRRIGVDEE